NQPDLSDRLDHSNPRLARASSLLAPTGPIGPTGPVGPARSLQSEVGPRQFVPCPYRTHRTNRTYRTSLFQSPQTSLAVSTISRSLAISSSIVSALPS